MTPAEIIAAEIPALDLSNSFLATCWDQNLSLMSIFPKLIFMPTGGVDTTYENIKSSFDAGVSAVGMGSKLISKKLMEDKDYDTITSETKKVLELIKTIKN